MQNAAVSQWNYILSYQMRAVYGTVKSDVSERSDGVKLNATLLLLNPTYAMMETMLF